MAPQTDIPVIIGTSKKTTPALDKPHVVGKIANIIVSRYSVREPFDSAYIPKANGPLPMNGRLWCVQLVPQIWRNWRTKTTEGLPGVMMFLWAVSGLPFGVYAVAQNFNIPIQVQPQIFMALTLISWAQTLIYDGQWKTWKATTLALSIAATFAGAEAALIVTLTPIYRAGNEAPMLVVGIVSSILLAVGLLPPYGEMWKRHGRVKGISFIFLGMDWFGAFFSLMALVAQNTFDIMGGVLYILCCLLEVGIFASQLIWLFRTRGIRREAKERGMNFDDLIDDYETRGLEFKWRDRKRGVRESVWWCLRLAGRGARDERKPGHHEPSTGCDSEDVEKSTGIGTPRPNGQS
ncbi:hypothetical protein MKZ38_008022 [Zalerion maritima]|uniref:PQ loop repeat protein n=1 Tax=Zalerion maritima TaxID=339359 RepID=A0AAD5RHG1_9PEZI|nr:hypothetical protein MKZ38_008022 [Zalerion maritima]